nr:MAG TPA_asm: hypothetical protein [Caudoviricetes sp.]
MKSGCNFRHIHLPVGSLLASLPYGLSFYVSTKE